MSNKDRIGTIKLVTILNEIMNEVGDLDKLVSYSVNRIDDLTYSFEVDQNTTVEVFFQPEQIDQADLDSLKIPTSPNYERTYNVGYVINDIDTQATKTDYKTLIRILKTVSDVIEDFVRSHKEVEALLVFPMSKTGAAIKGSFGDPQKYDLYRSIMIKNIGRLEGKWNYSQAKYLGIRGLIIFKTDK